MAGIVLDYEFKNKHVTNPDGRLPADLPADSSIVNGPGALAGRNLANAVRPGGTAPIQVDWNSVYMSDTTQFHIRVIFSIDQVFDNHVPPQILIESRRLPFTIELQGQLNSIVKLAASVKSSMVGFRYTEPIPKLIILPNQWYVVDLLYQVDTLSLIVNEQLELSTCHGFGPNGSVPFYLLERYLYIEGQATTSRLQGRIAHVSIATELKPQLELLIDKHRTTPQWYITTSLESRRLILDAGSPTALPTFDLATLSWIQPYTTGAIIYNPAGSSAFHIYGWIYERYKVLPANVKSQLGYLASNEMASRGAGRKSLFQGGGIYWSPSTVATEVVGAIYLQYEATEEAAAWGFPLAPVQAINGGQMQRMQAANFYLRDGAPTAHAVNGDILQHFLETGGIDKWGFPTSNETEVPGLFEPLVGGPVFNHTRNVRISEFERASFYWSPTTKAHFTYGHIRARWLFNGGPRSRLGLPTTDEMDIPGGGRMSGFENGVITWYGAWEKMEIITGFRLFIGVLNTVEDEGFRQKQNDIYFGCKITKGSAAIFSQRFPSSGSWSNNNIKDFNAKVGPIIIPDPFTPITFTIDVWDEDDSSGDDHLGTWTMQLNASNSWGFRDTGGLINSRSFEKINNISAAVQKEVALKDLSEVEKFFNVHNLRLDTVDYSTYAEAFRDVDSSPEWYDPLDWLDKAFYEIAIKHLTSTGRCFGMTVEAINAQIGTSIFGQPLNQFNSMDQIGHVVAVKHLYQVGAASCWYFVGEFLSGRTHNPVDVFNQTEKKFLEGNWTTINISQNYDFGGAPHTIMPFQWDRTKSPAIIKIHDSMNEQGINELQVNFSTNTFHYAGANVYDGGQWSGGRLYYTPWSCVNGRPRTPIWEAVVLLIVGTIVVMGDDTETSSITGPTGQDLDAHGPTATAKLKAGQTLDGCFAKHPIMGDGPPHGNILLTRQHQKTTLPAPAQVPSDILAKLNPSTPTDETEKALPSLPKTGFRHDIKSKVTNGMHEQLIKSGSTHIHMTTPMTTNEQSTIIASNLNTTGATLSWSHARAKIIQLTLMHRNGLSRNATKMTFDLTASAPGTLKFSPKPGLSAVDLDSANMNITAARLTLTVSANGKSFTHAFDLVQSAGVNEKLPGSVRVKLTPGSTVGRLAIAVLNADGSVGRSVVRSQGAPLAVGMDVPEVDPPEVPR